MKKLLSILAISGVLLTGFSCSFMPAAQQNQPAKYVYSSDAVHIQLEVEAKIFKLLIKRPSGYCYNEGLYKVDDEQMKLRTLQLKGDPQSEKRYRQNQCELATHSIAIVTANTLKFQNYELSRVN